MFRSYGGQKKKKKEEKTYLPIKKLLILLKVYLYLFFSFPHHIDFLLNETNKDMGTYFRLNF